MRFTDIEMILTKNATLAVLPLINLTMLSHVVHSYVKMCVSGHFSFAKIMQHLTGVGMK